LTDCVTLWIGDSLGPVERACMRSVLRQGHSLALYTYRDVAGVPDGVEVRDASGILPENRVLRHQRGSVALFSDWFRYELQRRELGTWLDIDVYLVAPIDLSAPYLLAEYEPRKINGSVLRLPPDSPMLPALLEPFERGTVPDWLPWYWSVPARVRAFFGGKADLSVMPWGSLGTYALTELAHRFGLASKAQAPEVFHPAAWRDAQWIIDPDRRLDDMVTDRTIGIHLWNECIKDVKDSPGPHGSFLSRLHGEGAL
jgi:hypothetical protein